MQSIAPRVETFQRRLALGAIAWVAFASVFLGLGFLGSAADSADWLPYVVALSGLILARGVAWAILAAPVGVRLSVGSDGLTYRRFFLVQRWGWNEILGIRREREARPLSARGADMLVVEAAQTELGRWLQRDAPRAMLRLDMRFFDQGAMEELRERFRSASTGSARAGAALEWSGDVSRITAIYAKLMLLAGTFFALWATYAVFLGANADEHQSTRQVFALLAFLLIGSPLRGDFKLLRRSLSYGPDGIVYGIGLLRRRWNWRSIENIRVERRPSYRGEAPFYAFDAPRSRIGRLLQPRNPRRTIYMKADWFLNDVASGMAAWKEASKA